MLRQRDFEVIGGVKTISRLSTQCLGCLLYAVGTLTSRMSIHGVSLPFSLEHFTKQVLWAQLEALEGQGLVPGSLCLWFPCALACTQTMPSQPCTRALALLTLSLCPTVAINLIVQHIQDILNGGLSKRQQTNGYINGYTPSRKRQASESSSRPHWPRLCPDSRSQPPAPRHRRVERLWSSVHTPPMKLLYLRKHHRDELPWFSFFFPFFLYFGTANQTELDPELKWQTVPTTTGDA